VTNPNGGGLAQNSESPSLSFIVIQAVPIPTGTLVAALACLWISVTSFPVFAVLRLVLLATFLRRLP